MRFEYPVRFVCHVLRCSVSGYYSWRKALRARPCHKDAGLRLAIVAAHQRTRQTYSAVRLHAELIADGVSTSLWKVKKLRRELGLRCKQQRKFVRTTDSRHNLPVAENLVGRHFIRSKCNQVWVRISPTFQHVKAGCILLELKMYTARKLLDLAYQSVWTAIWCSAR